MADGDPVSSGEHLTSPSSNKQEALWDALKQAQTSGVRFCGRFARERTERTVRRRGRRFAEVTRCANGDPDVPDWEVVS